MINSSICSIDRTLSGTTSLGQNRPGSNEVILHIPQSSSITRASLSDCLVSYLGHSLGESNPSAEMQLVYSAAPADWADILIYKINSVPWGIRSWPNE